MNPTNDELDESLKVARRIDARCDEFEQALLAGETPDIEAFIKNESPADRLPLLEELLPLEVEYRLARGDQPLAADYAARFPEVTREQLAAWLGRSGAGDDALVGRKLHIYQCVSLVGTGAMGRVYLARHDDLQRHCALKILSPRDGDCDAEDVQRFLREGQATASLIHPNIVTLHAIGELAGTHFLEMEYVAGQSLRQLIDDEAPLPADRALRLACMIADGLAAAHRAGIVHRDVKPDNVLVTQSGVAKVGDFGLAKRWLAATDDPLANVICGTPNYMAPELFQGHPASPASDVYALGLCLFQMLTGHLPWQETSLSKLVQNGRTEVVPNVQTVRPDVSPAVADCVALLTAANPTERPVDAVATSLLLHDLLSQERDLESLLLEAFRLEPSVSWIRTGESYCVTRRLPGQRQQKVFLEPTSSKQADRILLLYSIGCPATPSFYEQALMQNALVLHGSLAIREIDGQKMFVVINAYPRSTVAPEEIRRSVLEIAEQADLVEQRLTGHDQN